MVDSLVVKDAVNFFLYNPVSVSIEKTSVGIGCHTKLILIL